MTEIECSHCKGISRSFQLFMLLEVPVPQSENATLAECLDLMSKEEIIPLEDGW